MVDIENLFAELERDPDMPVRLTSEKFMRAERKNRLESHHLSVTYRHFDKQTVRLNYEIDREKRSITRAFRKVVKTSGASDLGVPPKNERDTSYEKCPSYRQGLKLSNKRLYEWREVEKQLNKFIHHHELEMMKGKRKRQSSRSKENQNLGVGRDDEIDEVFDDDDASSVYTDKGSPSDVLKEELSIDDEVFDVKKWEKEMVESYTKMVSTNITGKDKTDGKLRSKSSPSFTRSDSEFDNDDKRPVRPHTAHAQTRTRPASAKSLPPRPMSAHAKNTDDSSKFLITKDTVFMKSGQKFEKLLDSRPTDKPVLVNNYLTTLKPPTNGSYPESDTASAVGSVNGLCTVQEGNEDGDTDDASTVCNDVTNGVDLKPNLSLRTLQKMKKSSRAKSASALSVASVSTQRSNFKHSNSDLSSYIESNRRKRRDSDSTSCSVFSRAISRTGSTVSSHRPSASLGIPSDISEISRGQDRLASEISAERPLATNKLVSVAKVVKCAMTFSRLARARALQQMQEENSSDAHEVIRQERLRLLQSRQNVLNSIASQWQKGDKAPVIEQVE